MGPARDIYDVMVPFYYLSKFFGLAPFKTKQNKGNKRLLSNYGLITIFRILLFLSFFIYFLIYLETTEFVENIAGAAFRVALYNVFIMTTIILTSVIVNQRKLIQIIDDFVELDRNLAATNVKVDYKTAKNVVLFEIIVSSVVFLATLVIQLFLNFEIKIYIYSIMNVIDYIGTLFIFQYCNLLLLLRQRYRYLHRFLEKIARNKRSLLELPPIDIKIKKAAKIHGKLHKIAKQINVTYEFQLFTIILVRFILIMTQLINLYRIIIDPMWGDTLSYVVVMIYLLFHVFKISFIACLSDDVAQKVNIISKLISLYNFIVNYFFNFISF